MFGKTGFVGLGIMGRPMAENLAMAAAAHELLVAGQAAGHGKESQPAIFELWRRQGGE